MADLLSCASTSEVDRSLRGGGGSKMPSNFAKSVGGGERPTLDLVAQDDWRLCIELQVVVSTAHRPGLQCSIIPGSISVVCSRLAMFHEAK